MKRTLSEQVMAHIKGCQHNDVEGSVCRPCHLLKTLVVELEAANRRLIEKNDLIRSREEFHNGLHEAREALANGTAAEYLATDPEA